MVKDKTIRFRMSESDLEKVKKQAAKLGLTVSSWIRMVLKEKISQ